MAKSLVRARTTAFLRQAGRCYYCSVLMWSDNAAAFASAYRLPFKLSRQLQCTAEHLRARQDGGIDSISNIAAACLLCNRRRHARQNVKATVEDYRALVLRSVASNRWHDPLVFQRGLLTDLPGNTLPANISRQGDTNLVF